MTSTIVKPETSGLNLQAWLTLCRQTLPLADTTEIRALRLSGESVASSFGIPSKKDEEWQFTDLSELLKIDFQNTTPVSIDPQALTSFLLPEAKQSRVVFLNGIYSPELSDISALPAGVSVSNLSLSQSKEIVKHLGTKSSREFFTALNTAGLSDVAVIRASPNTVVETPIHLLFLAIIEETPKFVQPRTLIVAETGSSLNIIENYAALAVHCSDIPHNQPYFTNAVTEIYLEPNAEMQHTRLQRESGDAFHIGRTAIDQARHSRYTLNEIALGAKLYRHNLDITQSGEQTETNLNGLAMISAQQTADTHSAIYLNFPYGTTDQLHKCIVDGHAHAIFNGKVFVPKPAQLTNASQLNRNLLISPKARVNTKPELQITADNVKCSHGATVSQLSADEVFYLQSRGLTAQEARNLLIDAFSAEILDRIPLESLRQRLGQCVACRSVE
jgi:Fe-S cluster assembly protein SufD